MGSYDPKKTLDEANPLHVICPIFQAETPIATCFKLRDIVWRGDRPAQRQGCQACMRANKCPINNIIWDMIRNTDLDPYWSSQKKTVNFKEHDLERIARVKVTDWIINSYSLNEKELAMINKANAQAAIGVFKKGRPNAVSAQSFEEAPEVSDTAAAAKSGDMSAAINAVMEKENGQS